MKLKLGVISAILTTSITVSPMIVSAATDYSYLEDMSVKELKELDAAIHELLNDTPESKDVSDEELTFSDEDKIAVLAVNYIIDNLKNPHSINLFEISVKKFNKEYYAYVNFSATNDFGGEVEKKGYYAFFKDPTDLTIKYNPTPFSDVEGDDSYKKMYDILEDEVVIDDIQKIIDNLDMDVSDIDFNF